MSDYKNEIPSFMRRYPSLDEKESSGQEKQQRHQAKKRKHSQPMKTNVSLKKTYPTRRRKRGKKRKVKRFVRGMILYAAIFLIILWVILLFFWAYLNAYEKSRPTYAVQKYCNDFDLAYLEEKAGSFLDSLNSPFQNREEASLQLSQEIVGHITYKKSTTESLDNTVVYILSVEENELGKVTFTKPEDPSFGFSAYELTSESLDFSWTAKTYSISVPEGWTVLLAGVTLDESYITSTTSEYKILEEFYADSSSFGLPTLITYSIPNVVGDLDFTVTNPSGVSYESKDLQEEMFYENISSDETQQLETFTNTFLPLYVQCLSNANHNATQNFYNIDAYLVTGGNLETRLYEAISGQYWANSNGDNIQNITFNSCKKIGDNFYLVDVTYVIDTIGTEGTVQSTSNNKILIQGTENGYFALDISSY